MTFAHAVAEKNIKIVTVEDYNSILFRKIKLKFFAYLYTLLIY